PEISEEPGRGFEEIAGPQATCGKPRPRCFRVIEIAFRYIWPFYPKLTVRICPRVNTRDRASRGFDIRQELLRWEPEHARRSLRQTIEVHKFGFRQSTREGAPIGGVRGLPGKRNQAQPPQRTHVGSLSKHPARSRNASQYGGTLGPPHQLAL